MDTFKKEIRRDHDETTSLFLQCRYRAGEMLRHEAAPSHEGDRGASLPHITRHAVLRYIHRVDSSASHREAHRCIERILVHGRVRSSPRHWMRQGVRLTPGLRFVYWAEQADVCLLVLENVVVTIVTRALFRRRRAAAAAVGVTAEIPTHSGDLERRGSIGGVGIREAA